MKNLLIYIALFFSTQAFAQQQIEIDSTWLSIDTSSKSISLKLALKLDSGYIQRTSSFKPNNSGLTYNLVDESGKVIINRDQLPTRGLFEIGFDFDNVDQQFLDDVVLSNKKFYIETNQNIIVEITNSDQSDTKKLTLTKKQVKTASLAIWKLNDDQTSELVNEEDAVVYKKNNIDFGIIPKGESDTEKTEFFVSYVFNKAYSFINNSPLYFSSEGLISTNSRDSLNYMSIYPISYQFAQYDKNGDPKTSEFIAQLGVEGNQTFTNYRISANATWQGIIPNLIDLTFGENRLRLKPVIKVGLKFYQEFENNRLIETENELSNQAFSEFYYYIPIKGIYSLILDGNLFYDFSESVNPDHEFKYNIAMTLGIEIPKTEFKTIVKYVNGENGITYQKDQLLMIGFMADLFNVK